jgi:hypothetical protein
MTRVMSTTAQDVLAELSVADVLDFYTEQVNAAIAADRDDIVRDLTLSCEAELAEMGRLQQAA